MDIYTRDLVRSGHGTIGTPVIAGMLTMGTSDVYVRRRRKRSIDM
jgi:hypothetical protein